MKAMRRWIVGILCLLSLPVFGQQMSRMEAEFNRVTQLYEQRDKNALRQLRTYLAEYPYTTFESDLYFMMGVLQTERGYYKRAIKEFEKADYKDLTRPHQPQYQFYRGYAHLMQSDYEKGALYFGNLQKHKTPYQQKATYYYDAALPALLELEDVPLYRKTVPYYIVQIRYSQGDDEAVRAKAEELLDAQPDNENNGELHRMLGEIYYRQGRYRDAAQELKAYDEIFTAREMEVLRNDLYLLGVSQFQIKQYREAVETLKRVKDEDDAISEDVCLCLGNAYIRLGEIEQAKLAFLAATNYHINPKVHEEAMYNYALAVYQSSSSIGESETVFTDFIHQYPNSEHVNEIYMLLSDAFRRAKNYTAALSALDSVRNPNQSLLETKQYLRYQVGSDAFVCGKFGEARDWFTAVIKDGTPSPVITDAYYWRAETDYRLDDFPNLRLDLDAFFARKDAAQSPNRTTADYLNGYYYFRMKDYDHARTAFEQFVQAAGIGAAVKADAQNRIGDCYFYARQFEHAATCYEQAAALNTSSSDYALFQQGYSLGLLKQFDNKIRILQQLVARYPKSDYADDALYEIARVRLSLEQEREAIEAYEQLLTRYPRSNKARSASIERAMAYRNIHDFEHAIDAYKHTIELYPASQEAYLAVEGLEAVYIETNRVNEFMDYSKKLSKLNMQVATQEDSLSYAAAELQYRQGNLDAALKHFAPLSERVGSPYAELSAISAASIYFAQPDYAQALTYYRRSLELASEPSNSLAARLGILRCLVAMDKPQDVIETATQILAENPTPEASEEALYQRAKALLATGQFGLSVPDLTTLSQDVRTSVGAESKYLLAQAYFELKAYDNAEAEIMAFAQQPTQQQYWLARSLILLAEISHERGDDFQARQYLLSVKANYTNKDDILQRVEEHLTLYTPAPADEPEEEEN